MSTTITYNDAFTELQQIVSDIENGDINVDALGEKIRRASELITVCKAKLTASEEEVEKLLAKLEETEDGDAEEES